MLTQFLAAATADAAPVNHFGFFEALQQGGVIAYSIFTVLVIGQVIFSRGPVGYDTWAGIFSSQWMKVATFVVIASLLYHVWVGMRDVLMDYIQPVGIRLAAQIFTIVWLVGCAGWAIQVLWRL